METQKSNLFEQKVFERAKTDFKVFVEYIRGFKNAPFQNELDNIISDSAYKRIVISYPRNHGKSQHISVSYVMWLMAMDHNVTILLVCNTESMAKDFLAQVISNIEANDRYQRFACYVDKDTIKDPADRGVIPQMKGYSKAKKNWSGRSISIRRTDLNVKEPTVTAVGLFGSILSKRAKVIICDDIVDQENSETEDQRKKVVEWVDTTIRPVLLASGSRFLYLGNTWHMDDLVSRLLKNPFYDYRNKVKAIIQDPININLWDEWAKILYNEDIEFKDRQTMAQAFYEKNKEAMDEGIQLLWPDRFEGSGHGYGWFYLERKNNPYAFARMYQCDPSLRPDQKFEESWLQEAINKGSKYSLQLGKRDGFEMELTTEGLDLAISEEKKSDDTVLLTLDRVKYSTDPNIKRGDIFVRNIWRGKFSPATVRNTVKEHYDKLQPDGIRVESVGFQESMVRDLDDMGVPVRGYKTGKEKKDPYAGVNSLAIFAEDKKLILPYDIHDPATTRLISQLMNEMRAFPDGHTGDSLMAMWFAFSEMRDLDSGRLVVPSIDNGPLLREPVNIKDPVILKEENKKADQAIIAEQNYEKEVFMQMMRHR